MGVEEVLVRLCNRLIYLCSEVCTENARTCRRQGLPDRRGAGTSVRRERRMGFVILTAKPIAGHGTEASGRSSGQDDPAAADASAWILAGDRRQPWIIGLPAPRQTAMPGTPRQSRPPLRSSKRLPWKSISLPGVTLSDEEGQGERAQCRLIMYVALGELADRPPATERANLCAAES